MKNRLKRFLVVLCVLTMALGLTACGGEDNSIKYDENAVNEKVTSMVMTVPSLTVDAVKQYELQLSDEDFEMLMSTATSWADAADLLGGNIQGIDSIDTTSDEDTITSTANVVGVSGRTAKIEVIMDKRMDISSCAINVNKSLGELMVNAALNTLLGMGTVFVVLILMCFIIYAFKLISVFENSKKKKQEAPSRNEAAAAKAVEQIIETEEQQDDLELVAVISAAIAAFEESKGGSGDGYVVRSIKRRY